MHDWMTASRTKLFRLSLCLSYLLLFDQEVACLTAAGTTIRTTISVSSHSPFLPPRAMIRGAPMSGDPHRLTAAVSNSDNCHEEATTAEEVEEEEEVCDVLILGAGPAGIGAARHLLHLDDNDTNRDDDGKPPNTTKVNNTTLTVGTTTTSSTTTTTTTTTSRNNSLAQKPQPSVIVLEARNRVGGRAYTSDELNVGLTLDHGAKWIHGNCEDNRMVQLLRRVQKQREEEIANRQTEKKSGKKIPDTTSTSREGKKMKKAVKRWKNITRVVLPNRRRSSDGGDDEVVTIGDDDVDEEINGNGRMQNVRVDDPSEEAWGMADDAFDEVLRTVREAVRSSSLSSSSLVSPNGGNDVAEKDMTYEEVMFDAHKDLLPDNINEEVPTDMEDRRRLFYRNWIKRDIIGDKTPPDVPADEFLDEVMALFHMKIGRFFDFWEGAPLDLISAKHGLDGTSLPGGNANIPFCYGELVKRLAQPLVDNGCIRLEHEVVSVTSSVNEDDSPIVCVQCKLADSDGTMKRFRASRCIVALPVGVLQCAVREGQSHDGSKRLHFHPPLPALVTHSIDSLGIAIMNKIELSFPTRWWPEDVKNLTIASSDVQTTTYHPFGHFLVESASSASTLRPNILVCYAAGKFAKEVEEWTDEVIQRKCMEALRQAGFVEVEGFDKVIPDPSAVHVTRWNTDPFSKGSWTFFAKHSSPRDITTIRTDDTCMQRGLYFAGEYACDGSITGLDLGCVHGAWLSGELAAKQAEEAMLKSRKIMGENLHKVMQD